MDILALVFLIAGKVTNTKGLMTVAIVISSICVALNLLISVVIKDDKKRFSKALLGLDITAIILTLSIIFRGRM